MKDLYEITRHLVWLTQFGLSICVPLVLSIATSVWLQKTFSLDGWVVAVGVILGILIAVNSLRYSLRAIERQGKGSSKKPPPPISFNQHG